MKQIKFIEIIAEPSWLVGLVGSGFLMSMLLPKCNTCNQFILGILIGMIMTIIAFWMSITNKFSGGKE